MQEVAIKKCKLYEDKEVYEAVSKLVEQLGGWKAFIKSGSKVAIKPNLVRAKRPEDAVTTHPLLVKAVISQIQKAGGMVTIVESPGGPYNHSLLKYVYKMTGIEKVADETGAILNYDLRVEGVSNPHAKYIKGLEILKPLFDADIIINLPKLKTHTMMAYTGAVKNMYGAVAGAAKADLHVRMPDYHQFADSIIDVYLSVKPTLHLMDAITGMEGYGPTSGNPRHLGFLLASSDGFALDSAAVQLIHLPIEKVPVLKQAKDRNLIDDDIRILGEELERIKIQDYNIPALREVERNSIFDRGFLKVLQRHLRPKPIIDRDKCVGCGTCVKNCPPKVIQRRDKVLTIDYAKCIRCFCCHELCDYHAIDIRRSLLSKVMVDQRISGFLHK